MPKVVFKEWRVSGQSGQFTNVKRAQVARAVNDLIDEGEDEILVSRRERPGSILNEDSAEALSVRSIL